MKLLLDTSVFLWMAFGDPKLGRKTKRLLEATTTELWLSPISIWESMMLERGRKIRLEPNPLRWARDTLAAFPFHEAPLNHEVALRSRAIVIDHEDPADRFLAATAAVYDLTLLTADKRLLEGRGYTALENR